MNGLVLSPLLVMALATACGNGDSATAAGNTGGAFVASHSGGVTGNATESSGLTGGNSAANTTSSETTTNNGGGPSGGSNAQQSSQLPMGGDMSSGGTNPGAGGAPSGGASSTAATGVTTSVMLGGASATGGTTTTSGALSTGGTMPAGGSHTGGTTAGLGGVTFVATASGGSNGDAGPTAVVNMTLRLGSTAADSSELDLTLPDGAAPILATDITLTWCGRLGGGTTLDPSALKFDQATLVCPVNATADCSNAASYPFTPSVSVSAPGMNGCYSFELNAPARSLWPKGLVKLVYRLDSQYAGIILNRQFEEIWSVLVEGNTVGHCTIPPFPSATPVCG